MHLPGNSGTYHTTADNTYVYFRIAQVVFRMTLIMIIVTEVLQSVTG